MPAPEIVRTVAELRDIVAAWRRAGCSVGMVPTMGALHEGHLTLVREAQKQADRVVVTLFVNPAQFAPSEDLAAYPRTEASDRGKLAELAPHLLFAPAAEEIYPAGFATNISVGGPALGLESDFRPHFFAGVATVVAKLLIAGLPDSAYFGEKDYQQLLVVKQLARDLDLPTRIVGCPTVRAADGLALSSRNAYLTPSQRASAPRLHAVLQETATRALEDIGAAVAQGRRELELAGFSVDYLELRDAETLATVQTLRDRPARLLVAVRLGSTRLIDNVAVPGDADRQA